MVIQNICTYNPWMYSRSCSFSTSISPLLTLSLGRDVIAAMAALAMSSAVMGEPALLAAGCLDSAMLAAGGALLATDPGLLAAGFDADTTLLAAGFESPCPGGDLRPDSVDGGFGTAAYSANGLSLADEGAVDVLGGDLPGGDLRSGSSTLEPALLAVAAGCLEAGFDSDSTAGAASGVTALGSVVLEAAVCTKIR